jgi:RNA polymerase sigma factor (sigma-70 family)
MDAMLEQNRSLAEVIAAERPRLRSFIRRRVPNQADVDDLVQEVLCELVEAHRMLTPIDFVSGWLFRVARNRITDFFRRKKPVNFPANLSDSIIDGGWSESPGIEDLLPSPDASPEALYLRRVLLDELEIALAELPREQREVFIAHEFEGHSFKELAAATGLSINTLLSRKRYAVLHLRARLEHIHEEFSTK